MQSNLRAGICLRSTWLGWGSWSRELVLQEVSRATIPGAVGSPGISSPVSRRR